MPTGDESPPPDEKLREFVISAHGDLGKVKMLLGDFPGLLNVPYQWNETDRETAIQAAAQVGNVPIAEYLLENGAPLEICTAAMLGRSDDVERLLIENPERIKATGAHGIPLLTHAAISGNLDLVRSLFERGARTGESSALHNAVVRGHYPIVKWLLENTKPDLGRRNFQGKTVLQVAVEQHQDKITSLLKEHGAKE